MSILDEIAAYKRDEVVAAKSIVSLAEIEARAQLAEPPRGFLTALSRARDERRFGLIAELKKASPSKGLIRADFDPPSLAQAYERGGATCISVLTDGPSFQGSLEYLKQVRSATNLPVLRKDFMLDPYQISESRAWGADCILIIMAMLDDSTAQGLLTAARKWRMDALVEVHDRVELERALAIGAKMVGINNRDLNSFETDLNVTLSLASHIPKGTLVVAESGLSTPEDLRRLAKVDVRAFLIGESLMRESDVAAATSRLIGAKVRI
jgi:indole-3-glycerol phosphate synthase